MRVIGVDTGGTFTDLVYVDEATAEVASVKTFSTSEDPSQAVLQAVQQLDRDLAGVELFVHGTTVATNAVIERRGAKVGLITTAGHADRLDLQRCNLTTLYDLFYRRPRPLVERGLRREVRGRLRADGSEHEPLDEEAVVAGAGELVTLGAEVIAICFLNSYANPLHEHRAKALVAKAHPELPVVTSADVLPEMLEYERFSTTAISAYLTPVMGRYLGHLEGDLGAAGFHGRFRVMQGNGGLMDNATARALASTTLESGPAAGVSGAIEIAGEAGLRELITLDMGGTSTDVCLIQGGVAATTSDYLIDGLPMRQPLMDIVSVGAGGGSIAWLDEGGGLHVGPASAGADPGPACYARGGSDATVTDAHVVLGRLSPTHRLGDILAVDKERATTAIGAIAAELEMDPIATANGILTIAEANIVDAIRLTSVERGIDPREFVLVAYGGAGPLSAGRVAAQLGIGEVLVPRRPGIHSALGLTMADLRHDFVQTVLRLTDEIEWGELETSVGLLAQRGRQVLVAEGVEESRIQVHQRFDMRYIGQAYVPVSVSLPEAGASNRVLAQLVASFHERHEHLYGHSAPEEPTEIVSVRVTVTGTRERARGGHNVRPPLRVTEAALGRVYFDEVGDFVDCPFWKRSDLVSGFEIDGPCVVTQMDATTVVYPGQRLAVDAQANIRITT